jgi:threonine dehydratase
VLRTPLRRSEWLSAITGGDVLIKIETLQPTSSYKIRGAMNAVLALRERGGDSPPLVTASAGNHGRALALAAAASGLPLTVYVPGSAPATKLIALRRSGATIVLCRDYDDAERQAKEQGARGSARFISPYADPDVIAGAGTVAREILEQAPDVEVIVVAMGGGGLASGVAIAAQGRAKTYGVEALASCPFTRSLAAGRIVPIQVDETLADGLAGNLDPGSITFDLVRRHLAAVSTVTESQITAAIAGLVSEERLIAEGAAATAFAGLLSGHIDVRGRRTAVVLSGANIDPPTLGRILTGGT